MSGVITGVCWAGLMAVVGNHPDRDQVPVLARVAEREVLQALAEQRRDEGSGSRSLLDRVGPQEPLTICQPTGDLDLTELLA